GRVLRRDRRRDHLARHCLRGHSGEHHPHHHRRHRRGGGGPAPLGRALGGGAYGGVGVGIYHPRIGADRRRHVPVEQPGTVGDFLKGEYLLAHALPRFAAIRAKESDPLCCSGGTTQVVLLGQPCSGLEKNLVPYSAEHLESFFLCPVCLRWIKE